MKRARRLPELLAPAGDMRALLGAIAGGADAVYVGGMRFGARAFAKNFTDEELSFAVRLCHIHGVRLYVTLNTLVLDKEVSDALAYARLLYEIGVDALIVADVGMASLIKKEIPKLELHASTQMGVHNTAGADFAYGLGASRVVLARECSYKDIKKITEEAKAECEVFLHGALCVCHSGQCLFSSMVGGRSGNRGECAQPCRLPYNKGKYILSLKDLSLANHVKELIECGVSSLKIEGRMKTAEYVYEVTRIYRKLLDESRNSTVGEDRRLADVFSRDGFTDGYFRGKLFGCMTGVRTEEDKKVSKSIEQTAIEIPKIKIKAKARFVKGEKCELSFTSKAVSRWGEENGKEVTATAFGDVPSKAETSPLDTERVKDRLAKMGNTPFTLSPEEIDIYLDEKINLPPSSINALRREASRMLEERYKRPLDEIIEVKTHQADGLSIDFSPADSKARTMKTALFFKSDTLLGVLNKNGSLLSDFDVIFVPLDEYRSLPDGVRKVITGIYIPPIIMESEWDEVLHLAEEAESLGAKHALIGNISHIQLLSGTSLVPVADFRFNIANKYSKAVYSFLGVENVILSPELTLPQARDIGGGIITLGRIPLMITERCFTKENFGCNTCGKAALTDRKGMKFPLLREYRHRNVIFNSAPTYMGDKKNELKSACIESTHFMFSTESADECVRLLNAYKRGEQLDVPHRRLGKR